MTTETRSHTEIKAELRRRFAAMRSFQLWGQEGVMRAHTYGDWVRHDEVMRILNDVLSDEQPCTFPNCGHKDVTECGQ